MILSLAQIEDIAAATTKDLNRFFFREDEHIARSTPRGTPIDQLASQYLGLKVSFTRLSPDGSLCGVTAYSDTEYIVETDGMTRTIPLKRNQVLLDSSFIDPGQIKKLCGKRRFTLAHECAHQILFQMESDASKTACRRLYSERRAYSLRDLKTKEDWNEWQANALGAAILMPQEEIKYAILRYCPNRKLVCYENHFIYIDRLAIKLICDVFKVSKTALTIRLRQLGYLEDRPFSEYRDPLEVWPCADVKSELQNLLLKCSKKLFGREKRLPTRSRDISSVHIVSIMRLSCTRIHAVMSNQNVKNVGGSPFSM